MPNRPSRHIMLILITVAMLSITGCNTSDSTPTTNVAETLETEASVENTTRSTEPLSTNPDTVAVLTPKEATPTVSPFESYVERTSDFMGWLKIDGTQIDEPLMKSVDNNYYLNHDIDGKLSSAGSLYMDFRHIGQFKDNHMAIYGHYMTDGSMFHDLHKYKDLDFLKAHNMIEVQGLYEAYMYEIFSVHIVSADSYFLYFDMDPEMLLEYAKHFSRLSMHEIELSQPMRLDNPNGLKLLTLVTCTYEFGNARLLIHAFQHHPIDLPATTEAQ